MKDRRWEKVRGRRLVGRISRGRGAGFQPARWLVRRISAQMSMYGQKLEEFDGFG
jgi:hypothetical protein